jgi:hypothetical protein
LISQKKKKEKEGTEACLFFGNIPGVKKKEKEKENRLYRYGFVKQ